MPIGAMQFLGVTEEIFSTVEGASFAIASAPTGELGADFLELAQEHAQLQQALAGYRGAVANKDRDAVRKAQRDMGDAIRTGGQQSWSDIVGKLKGSGWPIHAGFFNTPSFQDYHPRTTRYLQATLAQPFRDILTTIQPHLDKIVRAQEEAATLAYGTDYQAAEPTFIASYSDYETVIHELDRIEFQPARETFESALLLFDHVATILDRGDELWRPLGRVDLTITNHCAHVNRIRAVFLGYLERPEQAARAEEIAAQHHITMARVVSEDHPQEAIEHYEQAYAYYKECVEYYISQKSGHELMRVGFLAIETIEEAVLICHRLRDENNFNRYRIDQSNLANRLLRSGCIDDEGKLGITRHMILLLDHDIAFYQQLGATQKILHIRTLKINGLSQLLHLYVNMKNWDEADQTFTELVKELTTLTTMQMLLGAYPIAWEGIETTLELHDWMVDTLQRNGKLKEAFAILIELLIQLEGFLIYEYLMENRVGQEYFSRIKNQIGAFYEKIADLLRRMGKWEELAKAFVATGLGFKRFDSSSMHPMEALLKNFSTILERLRNARKAEFIGALEDPDIDLQKWSQQMERFLSTRSYPHFTVEGDSLVMRDSAGEILKSVPIPPEAKAATVARIKESAVRRGDRRGRGH